jgi:hypothetical protein
MSFRWQMISIAVACALAFIFIYTSPPESSLNPSAPEAVVSVASAAAIDQLRATQFATHDRQLRDREEQLFSAEADIAARSRAARKMPEARQVIQFNKNPAWINVISTNRALYLALREQAAKSPNGQVPCTICDSKSYMRGCVVCEIPGKCPACKGSGRTPNREWCPVCVGSGKCFLCSGIGRMLCPFCDDGMIDFRRPPPATTMPIQ